MKQPTRLVEVDLGWHPCQTNECIAKVIKEETRRGLFDTDQTYTTLFVEVLSGGERLWVDTWRELTESTQLEEKHV